MFRLFFAGGESPVWRKALTQAGVKNIGISFANLKPRLPKTKTYLIAARFDDDLDIMLDSGGFAANKKIKNEDTAREYFEQYAEFVTNNIDRVSLVTELDLFGFPELVEEWRADFWSTVPADKFLPVWHPSYGAHELERLASRYPNLAVVSDHQLRSKLNPLVSRHGVNLHATVTKAEDIIGVHYSSAMSSSWTSPMRYGETHIWDGRTIRKYPTGYKERRRRDKRNMIERAGFDARKIADDDYDEVVRFTIWSWQQLEAKMARRRDPKGENRTVVDISNGKRERSNGRSRGSGVDTHPSSGGKAELVHRDSKTTLPIMGQEAREVENGQGTGGVQTMVPTARKESVRVCDSCYIQHACPEFRPGHDCAFELPTRIQTKDELVATLMWMFEVQAQRVAFARFVEEKEGGYPDQNCSAEMDRFFRMAEKLEDIKSSKTTLDIKYRSNQQGGALTEIFGAAIGQRAAALPEPLDEAETEELTRDFLDVPSTSDDED